MERTVLIQFRFRFSYCFTPYQRLWLYNDAPLVAFYDTLGIRRTYSRLKPPASSRGFWYSKRVSSCHILAVTLTCDHLSINYIGTLSYNFEFWCHVTTKCIKQMTFKVVTGCRTLCCCWCVRYGSYRVFGSRLNLW